MQLSWLPLAGPALPDRLALRNPEGDGGIVLHLRSSARARRLSLRQDMVSGEFRLTVFPGATRAQIERFILRHYAWIAARDVALPPRIPFEIGQQIPVLGVIHAIVASNDRRPVTREADPPRLLVSGLPAHHARRIGDYLKAEACCQLTQRSRQAAARLGCTVTRARVREMRSRWGSCSANGSLSYSWRLILAPMAVLDYVVAHEVSHLIEMNHGPRFWALVNRLSDRAQECRDWLRQHGKELWRYG